jgi:hypothetical protein
MKYLKIALLVGIFCLTGHFLLGDRFFSQVSQASVQWMMEPCLEKVRPLNHDPVLVTLKTLDSTGKPLKEAKIHLRLFTPPANPWFSTDFPWVEGTTLLDMTQTTASGEVQFQQTFPIRGNYRLQLQVEPLVANSFKPFEQTITWAIAEKAIKYRNYVLLLVLLTFIGFVGGWVIGAEDRLQAGEVAPQRVRILLSSATIIAIAVLLFINLTAEAGSSHTGHAHLSVPENTTSSVPKTGQQPMLTAQLKADSHATVGQLSTLTVTVKNPQTQTAIAQQPIRIQTHQLEHQQVIFATQTHTDLNGQFQWQEQFFDGSPHQVTVTLLPNPPLIDQPLTLKKAIEVEALQPPLFRRLISLGYMVLALTLGFGGGFGLHQQQRSVI